MNEHVFKKEYLCIVEGFLNQKSGIIDLPISRKPGSIIERCVDSSGQPSRTIYKVVKEFEVNFGNDVQAFSLVSCKLETGRTHQIRVHFSYIGHPLLGDTLYGKPSTLISRQALHSYQISFIHPITKKEQCFTCPLPNDMNDVLSKKKSKSVSRVLSFKIVIYLGYILLYTSSHASREGARADLIFSLRCCS